MAKPQDRKTVSNCSVFNPLQDRESFNFLEFLARIKDGDPSLKHLHAMAHSDPANKAFHQLTIDMRDQLQIQLKVLDIQNYLLPNYKKNCSKMY